MSHDTKIPLLQDLLYRGQPEAEDQLEKKDVEHYQPSLSLDDDAGFEIERDEIEIEISNEQEVLPEEITQQQPEEKLPAEITTEPQQQILEQEIRLILEKQMDKAYKKIMRLINETKS